MGKVEIKLNAEYNFIRIPPKLYSSIKNITRSKNINFMIKKTSLFLIIFAFILDCSAQKVSISGKLEDVPDGTKITLVPGGVHMRLNAVDSAFVVNGKFVLTPEIPEPRFFYIRTEGLSGQVSLLMGPSEKIKITGSLKSPVITGSPTNNLFIEKYVKPRSKINQEYLAVNKKFSGVSKRMSDARIAKDSAAIAEVEFSEDWIAYNDASGDLSKLYNEQMAQIAKENHNTFWGPFLIMANTAYLTPDFEKYYNMFSEEIKNSYYGKAFEYSLFGTTGVAPVFSAMDEKGNKHDLDEIISGKNYVLVDFWASWCAPCRKFIPEMKELANKYADKGLVVISVSIDEKKDNWLRAVGEENMPWLNLLDESGIGKKYGVTAIPSVFLIDPKGTLVFGKQSGETLITKLEEVFGK